MTGGDICVQDCCHASLQIQAPHALPCTSPQQVCHYIWYISGQDVRHQLRFQVPSKSIKMSGQLLCSHSLLTFYVDTVAMISCSLSIIFTNSRPPNIMIYAFLIYACFFLLIILYIIYKTTIVYCRYSV